MTEPITKKIALMASHDWHLRAAMAEFLKYIDPTVRWKGKDYKLELTRIIARPLRAGENLNQEADLIVDRTTHWNTYYRSWAHQAANSLARFVNHPFTFFVYDKHATFDLLARAMHPEDRFPKTVLLPEFQPWTHDQIQQSWWAYEQSLVTKNTELGFDESRRKTDWGEVKKSLRRARAMEERSQMVRRDFYAGGNYLQEVVENVFDNRFPLYLKKAYGGGGGQVYRIKDMDELYYRYDRTGEQAFHLQEAIEPYDVFYRAMGIGPIIFPMFFQPDHPHHQHYSEKKPVMDPEIHHRLESYVLFVNSYHRWTYNSFETLMKDGILHPIDFANACPDSHFTSLHVHFPLLLCSLVKWLSFCAINEQDMGIDMEMTRYLRILNDPKITAQEKFDFCRAASEKYFSLDEFAEFCRENFADIEEQMVGFYHHKFDEIIRFSIQFSDFPESEHEKFYSYYKEMMEDLWLPNAERYLTPAVFE